MTLVKFSATLNQALSSFSIQLGVYERATNTILSVTMEQQRASGGAVSVFLPKSFLLNLTPNARYLAIFRWSLGNNTNIDIKYETGNRILYQRSWISNRDTNAYQSIIDFGVLGFDHDVTVLSSDIDATLGTEPIVIESPISTLEPLSSQPESITIPVNDSVVNNEQDVMILSQIEPTPEQIQQITQDPNLTKEQKDSSLAVLALLGAMVLS